MTSVVFVLLDYHYCENFFLCVINLSSRRCVIYNVLAGTDSIFSSLSQHLRIDDILALVLIYSQIEKYRLAPTKKEIKAKVSEKEQICA